MRITREDARRLGLDYDALCVGSESSPRVLSASPSPSLVSLVRSPGVWVAVIADWVPVSDNLRARGVRAWHAGKRRDRDVLREMFVLGAKVPPAAGRRKVSLVVTKRTGRGVRDAANLLKSLHDGMKTCGLIVDDDETSLDWDRPRIAIDRELGYRVTSTITIEELA